MTEITIPVTVSITFNKPFYKSAEKTIIRHIRKHALHHALTLAKLELEGQSTDSTVIELNFDTMEGL